MGTNLSDPPNKVRVNVYLPEFLLNALDSYANRIGLSRSSALTTLIYPLYEKSQNESYMAILKEISEQSGSVSVDDMMRELRSILKDIKDNEL